MNTIRRYPRTLQEAFKGADYASAIERPSQSSRVAERCVWYALAAGAVAAILTGCLS